MASHDTQGRKFYENHLNYFYNRDVDGLVENDYTEDAVLVSPLFVLKGREALRKAFTDYMQMIGDMELKSTETFVEGEDCILIEATVETSKMGERKVYDTWVMRDGIIAYHFTGVR